MKPNHHLYNCRSDYFPFPHTVIPLRVQCDKIFCLGWFGGFWPFDFEMALSSLCTSVMST